MTEFAKAEDGVELAFERAGPQGGAPVLLAHGFGSSLEQNWKSTGWFATLSDAGYQVIAMDHRGHGRSGKPHDPAAYGHDRMAADVTAVMDAAGAASAFLVGYSMGGQIGLRLTASHPERVRRLVLAGVGGHYLSGRHIYDPEQRAMIADALLATDKTGITDPRARMFRDFADQPGKDRLALAACMRAMSPPVAVAVLESLTRPVLVVCGDKDDVAGPPGPLAAIFPQGLAVTIPGRDHMSAVGERKTRLAVLDFLAEPVPGARLS